jgi:hypothetical protein
MAVIPLCLLLNIAHLLCFYTTQVYLNSVNYLYVYVTCFSLYLNHP